MKAALALLLLAFSGCDVLGPGAGSGAGNVNFKEGFVFVRRDDRNVYVADSSDFEQVFRLTTEGNARNPSLSKDGKRVVFSRQAGTDTELVVVPTAGGGQSRVMFSNADAANLRQPVFSADGAKIVFTYDQGSNPALGIVNIDGSGFARLVGGGSLSYASPTFAPDGTVLAAAGSAVAFNNIERVQPTSATTSNITYTLGAEALSIGNRLAVSPDGRLAAFDARLAAGGSRIFIIDLTSKNVKRLTDYPNDVGANDSAPCWVSPDKVAFSSDTGGNDQVYVLPASASMTSGGLELPNALEPWFGATAGEAADGG